MVCSMRYSWWEDALGRHRVRLILLNSLCFSAKEVMNWPRIFVRLYLLSVRAESRCRWTVRSTFLHFNVSSSYWGSCPRTLPLSRSSSHSQTGTNFPVGPALSFIFLSIPPGQWVGEIWSIMQLCSYLFFSWQCRQDNLISPTAARLWEEGKRWG